MFAIYVLEDMPRNNGIQTPLNESDNYSNKGILVSHVRQSRACGHIASFQISSGRRKIFQNLQMNDGDRRCEKLVGLFFRQ